MRRTYSCLAIARRHPKLFASMTEPGRGPSGARFVTIPGTPLQAYHWPQVRDRGTPAHERRAGPRSSRFGGLQ